MNVGVLLAAGASSRMGSPKALVLRRGQSFLAHGVRALWSACDAVVVVLGAHSREVRAGAEEEFTRLVEGGHLSSELHAASRKGARALEVRFAQNAAWKRGMLSSVRCGLAEAMRMKPRGVFVLPVDHPDVRPETVSRLAGVMEEALGAVGTRTREGFEYALVPRHRGRRGHPLALSPALARAIARDRGARDLGDAVRRRARLVAYLDVKDAGVARNLNAPAR